MKEFWNISKLEKQSMLFGTTWQQKFKTNKLNNLYPTVAPPNKYYTNDKLLGLEFLAYVALAECRLVSKLHHTVPLRLPLAKKARIPAGRVVTRH